MKKTKTNPTSSPSPSFSSLHDEIIVNCLARISKSQYSSLCLVSKSFYSLLSSPYLYLVRSQLGATESRLYVCMCLPNHCNWFTLDEIKKGELSLVPVKLSSSSSSDSCYARLNATTVAAGSEIYQIGGAVKAKRSKTVLVLDCRNHTWRRGPDLTVTRKNAQSCFLDGKIYVIGGCTKKDEAMNWGEVFDLKTQTWKPLPSPSDNIFDGNLKVVVLGGRLYVFTRNIKYSYDPQEGRWVVLEVDLIGLEPITSTITGPWCIIENVMFTLENGNVKWYNPMHQKWDIVDGLIYANRPHKNPWVQLVNHGGKLVIIWHKFIRIDDDGSKCKRIWCAVIRLEKQSDHQIRGEVERCNVVADTLHTSHMLSSCLSVSV